MGLNCLRKQIIGVDTPIETTRGCVPRVYFNNSATTLVLKPVIEELYKILPYYTYVDAYSYNSDRITELYNRVRDIVLMYLGADNLVDTAIFTMNATDGLNIISEVISKESEDIIVLSTQMEHMANYLPYKKRVNTILIKVTTDGEIDMEDYIKKINKYKGKVKLVAVTAASNVTGVLPPIYDMARIAHENGAKIVVDIVQYLQHRPFTMKSHNDIEHIDFVAFSSHKCYTGLDGGALVGPADILNKYDPLEFGSGNNKFTNNEETILKNVPKRYEPAYPDVLGIICMGRALEFLWDTGLKNICCEEKKLYIYLKEKLKKIPNVKIYAENLENVGIPFISFNVKDMSYKRVAQMLGYDYGIEVAGGTCGSNIYVQSLLGLTDEEAYELYITGEEYGVVRVSLGFYNTYEEIDRFIYALQEIVEK